MPLPFDPLAQRPRHYLTPENTSMFEHVLDQYPMPSVGIGRPEVSDLLYEGGRNVDVVPPELYDATT
jgi:citrate synthase